MNNAQGLVAQQEMHVFQLFSSLYIQWLVWEHTALKHYCYFRDKIRKKNRSLNFTSWLPFIKELFSPFIFFIDNQTQSLQDSYVHLSQWRYYHFWPNISNNENRDLNLFLWFRRKEEKMSAFLSIKLTFWSSWLFIFGHGRTSPDW